jgi:hypothetical protein
MSFDVRVESINISRRRLLIKIRAKINEIETKKKKEEEKKKNPKNH